MISDALTMFIKNGWPPTLAILEAIAPVALALILVSIAWNLWLTYVRAKYFLSLKYVTLEIKIPKDQFKSPPAMEMVINAFHNTSDGDTFKQYWKGETRPWWSLELISIEGQVKFVIWLQEKRRNFIESSLYAQFPGIEIREIPDYTKSVHFDKKEIAKNLVISYFTQVYSFGYFHADMHPGNLFLMNNGDIAAVDFGIMGEIDKKTRLHNIVAIV
jgi:hypothetical protein